MELRWFPNSWVQVKSGDRVIYIDPAYIASHFRGYPGTISFSRWPAPIDGLPGELERAGLILVTHHHKDHCKHVTVLRLSTPDAVVVAPRACAKELANEYTMIAPGEESEIDGVGILAVHAYNTPTGRSTRKQHAKGKGVGYLVTVDGLTIYHAGDTDLIAEMNDLGVIDVAFLPIGGRFTMDVEEAVDAALAIQPRIVVPVHRLGADPLDFKRLVESRSGIHVAPLATGEALALG